MRIIAKGTLRDFWRSHAHGDSEQPLRAWYYEVKGAHWNNHNEVKAQYSSASPLKGNRVVFNISGNKYRLVVRINYKLKIVFVKFIGTRQEYDKIDVEKT